MTVAVFGYALTSPSAITLATHHPIVPVLPCILQFLGLRSRSLQALLLSLAPRTSLSRKRIGKIQTKLPDGQCCASPSGVEGGLLGKG